MIQRYYLTWLLAVSLAAYFWPQTLGQLGWGDPFAASAGAMPYYIVVIMFALGWLLPRDEFANIVRRWPIVLAGTAVQYTAMPLLAVFMARAARLEGDAFVGVVLVGCVPGAMASNVLTLMARGNVSYSVSLTTMSNLLSPLVVPLALAWAIGAQGGNARAELGFAKTVVELLFTAVAPLVLGYLLVCRRPHWQERGKGLAAAVANLAILWIIACVVAVNRHHLSHWHAALIAALLGLNVFGYLAGYAAGMLLRFDEPLRRALSLEIGLQNAGLGISLAMSLLADRPAVAIAPAMYALMSIFTGTLLAHFWQRRAPVLEQSRKAHPNFEHLHSPISRFLQRKRH